MLSKNTEHEPTSIRRIRNTLPQTRRIKSQKFYAPIEACDGQKRATPELTFTKESKENCRYFPANKNCIALFTKLKTTNKNE